jgi:putative glycosyltransferase (TIGR04372 family)|tara:strand:+ start:2030 stop:3457 length:1428 start_codon:yes stop_codon:yes gene_type:complete
MKIFRILINIYKNIFNNFFKSSEVDKVLNKINKDQKKLKSLKFSSYEKKVENIISLSKKYFKLYSNNPSYLFNHGIILQNYSKNPNDGFKIFENYENINNEWLKQNDLENLNQEFIPFQQLSGSLGNHNPLFYYLIYKKIFKNLDLKPNVLLQDNHSFTNPTLATFFQKDLNFIKSDDLFNKLKFYYELKKIPLEFTLPFKGKHYPWYAAVNFIRQEMLKNKNLLKCFFKLTEEQENKGKNILKNLGISPSDWFVTLHVREGKGNDLFNAKPSSYLKAVNTIYKNGGRVVRVGDKSMTRLDNVKGLIDYPFSEHKSDFMDVYLAAKNEFCIGTSSGYWSLPTFFKKPVLLTNYLPNLDYFMLDEKSVFLPKKVLNLKNNEFIKFEENFSFPLGYMCTNFQLSKNNIKDIDNSSDEIDLAVKEMLIIQNKFEDKKIKNELDEKNIQLKEILDQVTLNTFNHKLIPFGNFSSSILAD